MPVRLNQAMAAHEGAASRTATAVELECSSMTAVEPFMAAVELITKAAVGY